MKFGLIKPSLYYQPPLDLLRDDFSGLKFWLHLDVIMMEAALNLARQGAVTGEIPVGAVLVNDGKIIGQGYNRPISTHSPTAHAEIVALNDACKQLQNYRLPPQTTLYVTLEPCTMCFGALIHARVDRVVFGAYESKSGAAGSRLNLHEMDFYNHKIDVQAGLLACQCADVLSDFFKARRAAKKLAKINSSQNSNDSY